MQIILFKEQSKPIQHLIIYVTYIIKLTESLMRFYSL